MPNTRPAAKGALAMLEAALDRIQALGDPARAVTPAARQQAASAVEAGVHPLWAAAEATGLDMSQAARKARAREQGYQPYKFFHGTHDNYESMVPSEAEGLNFVTDNPTVASTYGLTYSDLDPNMAPGYENYGGNVIPVLTREPLITRNNLGGYFDTHEYHTTASDAKERGIAEIIGIRDAADYDDIAELFPELASKAERPSGIRMVRDPDDLRSVHAAFDPANRGTGYLMGSRPVATTTAGGLTLWKMYKDQQNGKR